MLAQSFPTNPEPGWSDVLRQDDGEESQAYGPLLSSDQPAYSFFSTALGNACEMPLKSLFDLMSSLISFGFEVAWVTLTSAAVREAMSKYERSADWAAPPGVEECIAKSMEGKARDQLVPSRYRGEAIGLPKEMHGLEVVMTPVTKGKKISGCKRVDCRFVATKKDEDASARTCSEAGYYPGECCFKLDTVRPVPVEVCRRCPVFPFSFVIIAGKREISAQDILAIELIRQRSHLVALELQNNFFLERHEELSLTLSRFVLKMGELLDLNKRVDLLLTTAMALLGADRGSVFLYDEDREEINCVASRRSIVFAETEALLPDSEMAAIVAERGKTTLFQRGEADCPGCPDNGTSSAISVPLLSKGEVLGVLNLGFSICGHKMCETDMRLAETLAYFGTASIENALLYDRIQRKEKLYRKLLTKTINAQEDERKRIASDIHDDTIQALVSSFYQLEAVEMLIESGRQTEALEELQEIKGGLQRNIGCMRRLLFDLRPSILDDAGLVPALENYLNRLEEETGVESMLYVEEGMPRLRIETEVALFRFAQELLTNIKKHANASCIVIQLKKHRSRVEMRVKDDGVGFDLDRHLADGIHGEHFGIRSLIERVELADGEIFINTAPGEGTDVLISIPEEPS